MDNIEKDIIKIKHSIAVIQKEKDFLVEMAEEEVDFPEAIETLISAVEELNTLAETL
jgi:hypothetical protein